MSTISMKKTKNMFSSKTCRICLISCDNSLHIFGEYYLKNYKKLKECLEEICDISVSPEDNLPEYICLKCTKLLEQCCNFRILARKNDCLLHEILKRKFKEEDEGVLYENEDHFENNKQISLSKSIESVDQKENYSEDLGTINTESVEQINFINIIEKVDLEPKEDPEDQFYTFDNEDYIEVEYDISTNEKIQDPQNIKQEDNKNENLNIEKKEKVTKFECKYCGKKFVYLKNKNNHEEKRSEQCHTNERRLGCDTCGRRYYTQRELNRHLKTHSGIKNFKCTYCGKAFHERGILNMHIRRVHLNERDYQCNICGKFFPAPSKVIVHQKTKICSQRKAIKSLHGDENEFSKRRTRIVRKTGNPQRVSSRKKKTCSQFKDVKSQKSVESS